MSYLKFDKNLMINLQQSLRKEMLRTNKSGAYHCTTIVGCNTRKQHGLLVIPIPEMDDKAHVLLSSLDETVIQQGAPFDLGLHQYGEGIFSPNGHKYIREFSCETVPTMTYRVGGVILSKEKMFISHENRILIKYTLLDAHSPTTLQFRPFLAFRNASELCMENGSINKETHLVENGISCCLYPGYPDLFMQFSKPTQWVADGHWYKGIEYYKDRNRGLPYKEDLWVPGYFELPINKGESVIFSASTFRTDPETYGRTYDDEAQTRTRRTSFYNCLKNSAKQCYLKNKNGMYLMAGYPWYNVRCRDELIALPGCTLSIDHPQDFVEIMGTFLQALSHLTDTGEKDKVITGLDLPDIPLWSIWAMQQYAQYEGKDKCRERYGRHLLHIISNIIAGNIDNLHYNADSGLLSTAGENTPVSWLNASIGGKPVIPRSGYLVEFNALWYNALRFAASLYQGNDEMQSATMEFELIAKRLEKSFLSTFLNDAGYLYDYVNGTYTDLSVRPNMVIAIGLPYSPLDRRQRKKVLDFATKELLTPKGLRTLSPRSYGYNPLYVGNPEQREYAVHQGPARPWLLGFYADAYLRVFGYSGVGFIERMLIGLEDEMTEGCIGSLSEMYDGNPPFTGRGAVSTAKNVGEVLRTLDNIKQINRQTQQENESL